MSIHISRSKLAALVVPLACLCMGSGYTGQMIAAVNSNVSFFEAWGMGPGPTGSSSPQNLCWTGGPASCYNYWTQTGSGAAVNTTPGSPVAAVAGPLGLEMTTVAGSKTNIYSIGYMPTLAAGTSFDLYFSLCLSSSGMPRSTTDDLVTVYGPSGVVAQVRWETNFADVVGIYANGASATGLIPITPQAWHVIDLHVVAGTGNSCVAVDTSTCASETFTAYSRDATTLYVGTGANGGNLEAMCYSLGYLRLDAIGMRSYDQPYTFIDQAGGTAGNCEASNTAGCVTTATLLASDHCRNDSGGWTATGTTQYAMSYVPASEVYPPKPYTRLPFVACGMLYQGDDSLLVQYSNADSPPTESFTIKAAVSPATTAVSWGHFWMTTVPPTDAGYYSGSLISANAGRAYLAEHFRGSGSTNCPATGAPCDTIRVISGQSSYIQVEPNTWYWVTGRLTPEGNSQLAVYETVTWTPMPCTGPACVGNVLAGSWATTNTDFLFGIGRVGTDATTPSATYFYWADFVMDSINAQFPLY